MSNELTEVKAIVFDVFGTVVDWRSSIISELVKLGERLGVEREWPVFADKWRDGYHFGTQCFRDDTREWLKADTMHLERLRILIDEYELSGLSEDDIIHLNKAWHRLDPWPDSVEGLSRLKQKFIIGTLSNGNTAILVNMAKHAGLPWDVILGAETFQSYKPDPKVYLGAVGALNLQPNEVMVAAAHLSDLYAARSYGLKTGFVIRPNEFGDSEVKADLVADDGVDVVATDFVDLAKKMGA